VAARPKYRRVLLKLSGEALGAGSGNGIDIVAVQSIARRIAEIPKLGVQLAIVVGGGNIIRGSMFAGKGINAVAGDAMGMLATVINGVALQDVLESQKVDTRLQTAIPMHAVAEPFIRRRCIRHLEKGRVVILAGGTGHPHFTTDTAAALRAREIHADVMLKATNVDGVYDDDPRKNHKASRYTRLTYHDVLRDNLRVMDATAVSLCREGRLPIIVFNMNAPGSIRDAILGKPVGTLIGGD
jgi:uridylate kinase